MRSWGEAEPGGGQAVESNPNTFSHHFEACALDLKLIAFTFTEIEACIKARLGSPGLQLEERSG